MDFDFICPFCSANLELNEAEVRCKLFVCPSCGKEVSLRYQESPEFKENIGAPNDAPGIIEENIQKQNGLRMMISGGILLISGAAGEAYYFGSMIPFPFLIIGIARIFLGIRLLQGPFNKIQ